METRTKGIKRISLRNLRDTQISPSLRIPQGVQALFLGLLTSFGLSAIISGAFFSDSAYAAYSASISRTSSGTITLSDGSGSSIKPSSSGTLGTGSDTVSVSSNCTAGYNLYVSAISGGSTNLSTDGGTDYIPSTTTATGSEATLTKDTWGVGKDGSKFSKLPAYSTDASTWTALYTGTGDSSSTAKNYTVYYGANVSTAKTPGTYTGDVLYTVIMNSACEKYTLKFDDDGATTINLEDQQIAFDAEINLADISSTDKIAKTGYTLTGWKDQNGNSYGTSGTVDVNTADAATVTLTAQWQIINSNVTVSKGTNVTTTTGTNSYDYNATVTIAATAFATGYHFSGWTVNSGDITLYSNSAMTTASTTSTPAYFKMPGTDVTVTANAAANTYTFSYNSNGATSGSPATSSNTGTYGGNVTTSDTGTMAKTGYHLLGWSTSSTATSATCSANASCSVSTLASNAGKTGAGDNGATITLYAIWAANTYNFSWNGNGGTASGGGTSGTYGGNVTTATATRSGYTFLGWAHSSTATAKTYNGNTSTAVSTIASGAGKTAGSDNGATITLYAVWQASTSDCSSTVHPTTTTGCKMKDDNIWILGNSGNTVTWNNLCTSSDNCKSTTYCPSGYTLPTQGVYATLVSKQGSGSQLYSALGLSSTRYFWSTTQSTSNLAYYLYVDSSSAYVYYYGKSYSSYVLCYKSAS